MASWRFQKFVAMAAVAVVLGVAVVAMAATSAEAQADRYETCAAYGIVTGSGGQAAADAAATLKSLGAPNPTAVDTSLDVVIDAESDVPPTGSRPTTDAIEAASDTLVGYYGPVCAEIDICPLIVTALGADAAAAADAARLARGISTPAPPGIDAALALVAGEITESPFHNSIGEAKEQVGSFFPCGGVAPLQPAEDVVATCGDLAVLSIPEGPRAIEAAENLRARGGPNPPGIEAALDVIVATADFSTPTPPIGDVDAALETLEEYFGGPCSEIDRCSLVNRIAGSDPADSAAAAGLLRRIETPSPPGIDAALALVAGEIAESPFHASPGEALQQILDYYPCSGSAGLAFTGTSLSAPLGLLGAALVVSGTGLLRLRRAVDRET